MNDETDSIPFTFRSEIRPADREAVRNIVETTGFFTPAEVEVAVELVDETLARGAASGYRFIMADQGARTVGYACFGLIPCTTASYDLYWIAVLPGLQGKGLGRRLLAECESAIQGEGGRNVYIETSNRLQYGPTRAFYDRCGYERAAVLEDFYAPGDDKMIFVKHLPPGDAPSV